MAIGVGESEYYFGSDATPFLEFTKRCVYLNDNEMVIVNLKKGLTLREIKKDSIIDPYIQELTQDIENVEKGGYDPVSYTHLTLPTMVQV